MNDEALPEDIKKAILDFFTPFELIDILELDTQDIVEAFEDDILEDYYDDILEEMGYYNEPEEEEDDD